jgi:outer membrane protein
MKGYLVLLFVLIFSTLTHAQTQVSGSSGEKISLQDCIDYALKNNLNVRTNNLQVEQNLNNYNESKYRKYPTANVSTNLSLYTGRNINPYTNGIITNTVGSNGYNLQGGMMIFDGYQTRNNILLNELNLEASRLDLQGLKNQVTLNIIVAYLNVLSQIDLLEITNRQLEVTKIQLERTQKLVNAGSVPETNLFDIKAQMANDELQIVNAENAVISAKLTLRQLMNMPPDHDIEVIRVEVPNPNIQAYSATPAQIYEIAQGYLAEVQAADMRIKAAQKNIEIAKGIKMPTIRAFANFGTNSTTVAEKLNFTQSINEQANAGYTTINGVKYPITVYVPTSSATSEKIGFFRQMSGNANGSVGFSINMPIFNGYNTKFRLASAQIQQKQSEIQSESVRVNLRQSIDQAYVNMSNASKRYSALQNQVRALEESFRAAESKFNVGSLNALDYNISKTNLDRAKANAIQAKYDYIFRIKILDFYQNKPLNF